MLMSYKYHHVFKKKTSALWEHSIISSKVLWNNRTKDEEKEVEVYCYTILQPY